MSSQPLIPIALASSLAAHVALGLAVNMGRVSIDATALHAPAAAPIVVQLHTESTARKEARPESANQAIIDSIFIDRAIERIWQAATAPTALPLFSLAAEARYFSANELTEKPLIEQDAPVDLSYLTLMPGPPLAATASLFINESGDIDRIEIEQSQLPDDVQSAVIEAYAKLKFHPGKINGAAVKSQLKIEVTLENVPAVRK